MYIFQCQWNVYDIDDLYTRQIWEEMYHLQMLHMRYKFLVITGGGIDSSSACTWSDQRWDDILIDNKRYYRYNWKKIQNYKPRRQPSTPPLTHHQTSKRDKVVGERWDEWQSPGLNKNKTRVLYLTEALAPTDTRQESCTWLKRQLRTK